MRTILKLSGAFSYIKSDIGIYCVLFIFSLCINKYVLTVLGFTYPTVYQGWQTFVGALLFVYIRPKVENISDPPNSSAKDCTELLFELVTYLITIIIGSKALSLTPLPVFIASLNMATICSSLATASNVSLTAFVVATTGLISSSVLLYLLGFISTEAQTWMLLYVLILAISDILYRPEDSYNRSIIKLYYKNVFSVLMLIPSSLYIGEAFTVLNFKNFKRLEFYVCTLLSGICYFLIQLYSIRLHKKRLLPGISVYAKVPAILVSLVFESSNINNISWHFIAVNLLSTGLFSMVTTTEPNEDQQQELKVSLV